MFIKHTVTMLPSIVPCSGGCGLSSANQKTTPVQICANVVEASIMRTDIVGTKSLINETRVAKSIGRFMAQKNVVSENGIDA